MRRMRTWNLVSGILKRRMLQQALGVFDMLFIIYTSYKLHESFSHNIYYKNTNGLQFFFKNWYRIDLTTYFVCNASKFCGFRGDPWLDDARQTTAHQIRAAEIKALKQISFPDMDSDGLPSSYTIKVVTCLGKWQMKMTDLSQQLDHTNPTMKPSPGCMLFLHAWHEFMLLGCRMLIALLFWFQLKLLNWSKRNHILHDRSIVFDFLSGWRQRLRPWFKTWASCLMRSARLIRLGLRKATLRSNLAYCTWIGILSVWHLRNDIYRI